MFRYLDAHKELTRLAVVVGVGVKVVATGGTDKMVNVFDLRSTGQPVTSLQGHAFAVRKVAWSPHRAEVVVSRNFLLVAENLGG